MPFNINEFRSQLENGGVAVPYTFEAYVFGPESSTDERELIYRIDSIDIPGRSIQTADRKISGPPRRVGYDVINSDINMTIILSEDFREKIYIEICLCRTMNV